MNLYYDGEADRQRLEDGTVAWWLDEPAWGTEPEPPQQFDTREEDRGER